MAVTTLTALLLETFLVFRLAARRGLHSTDEWVSIEALPQLQEIVMQYIIEAATESSNAELRERDKIFSADSYRPTSIKML